MAAAARFPQYNAVAPTEYPHMARPVATPGHLRPQSMDVFQKTVDPRVHTNTLAIEQLKAGQAKLNDGFELHKKYMDEQMRNNRKHIDDKYTHQPTVLTSITDYKFEMKSNV